MSTENEIVERGQVIISDDVVISMAGMAASTVKGVYTARTGVAEGITSLFSKNSYSKGIKVEINENNVVLSININVEYGFNISEVAKKVQESIKKEVETMTDLTVSAVNVNVLNIIFEKDKDKQVESSDIMQ